MNWISEWLSSGCDVAKDCDHCFKYCARRKELGDKVGCSEALIYILQYEHGGVTHPTFADRIADLVKATPEQRDSIVHAKHKGTYVPGKTKAYKGPRDNAQPSHMKRIVVVNCIGEVLNRFDSLKDTAQMYNCTDNTVYNRCNRKLKPTTDEFASYGVTFRYAEEWDAMTKQQQLDDILSRYGEVVYGPNEVKKRMQKGAART